MPELDYKLTEAKAELVKGEQSQEAVVNTEPKESVVNTISVDEVKEEVKKGVDAIPEIDLSGYYTKTQTDTLFPKKTDVSSMTLLGTAQVGFNDSTNAIHIEFANVDFTKITSKTILILTYANCFVMGMLSQTGEGRVAGNLVYDTSGNSKLGKVKFEKTYAPDSIFVDTDVISSFGSSVNYPTAYLFAFSVI